MTYSVVRKETGGDLAHVAIALQGAPAGTPQSLALAIAAKGKEFSLILAQIFTISEYAFSGMS